MDRFAHCEWPFFEARHGALAREADAWAGGIGYAHGEDADAVCRRLVGDLGRAGFLNHCAPGGADFDVRSIALLRETFAYHAGLADFAFVMQGLGSGPIALEGSDALRRKYLPRVAAGTAIAALALSEPDAGSDAGALTTRARRDGAHWVLDGAKTWISNGGIADFYVVFARTGDVPGTRGISAIVVDADAPGFSASERIDIIAPHPMATLRFENCRVPAGNILGKEGEGFKLAMRNLDVFRTTVAGAALGFARRALDEALGRARERRMFGHTLADFQVTQAKLADMATGIEAGALLTYRAAWARDVQKRRVTSEAAMAKMHATETAQQVVDAAVQIFGGLGVKKDHPVERLYREVRALRIYEGATEVQKMIIARELLKGAHKGG
ncbi:MAG: acyl-CoA dehydrogenase family protein [Proteobacteria bacterium]|nr:acyl-CoA dehydrogenase family protein [Pseudomonadota bacterium]